IMITLKQLIIVLDRSDSFSLSHKVKLIRKAVTDAAQIPCHLAVVPLDQKPSDFSWMSIPPSSQRCNELIIFWDNLNINDFFFLAFKDQVHSTQSKLESGDKEIAVTNLTTSSLGTSICRGKRCKGEVKRKPQLRHFLPPKGTTCFSGCRKMGNSFKIKSLPQNNLEPIIRELQIFYNCQKRKGTWRAQMKKPTIMVQLYVPEYSVTHCCCVGCRRGLDLALLRLWCRPADNNAGKRDNHINGITQCMILLLLLIFCNLKKKKEQNFKNQIHH
uniref:Uncharacterized protein n=1 Tax=Sus scrofa TaxID=9823 RepID=A0A8D1B0H0_PIG